MPNSVAASKGPQGLVKPPPEPNWVSPNPLQVVLTTVGSVEAAQTLAQTLVAEKLAACVQVIAGMSSYYHWQGQVQQSQECLLIIKTLATQQPALTQRLQALHPYKVPELVSLQADGVAAPYLDWVTANLKLPTVAAKGNTR